MQSKIAIIIKGYPRLSETFIAQELAALEAAGMSFIIYSLRRPHDAFRHPVHDRISARCEYLPEYIYLEPLRVLRSFLCFIFSFRFYRLLFLWSLDFLLDPSFSRGRRLAQGVVLAAEMPCEISHLYFHFIHTPGSVCRYASILRGLPYSGSAHAKDIWTSSRWDLRRKLKGAEWCVTCTMVGRDYLQDLLGGVVRKVHLVYHGLDVSDFPQELGDRELGDRQKQKVGSKKLRIVSVGRLVDKKGYDYLLPLLSRLRVSQDWEFIHVGGGDVERFRLLAAELGLGGRVRFEGARSRPFIIDLLSSADIFVLGNIVVGDGDRDGIPNVLMEALWMGVSVLAGDLPSIRELIIDGEHGLLSDIRFGDDYFIKLLSLIESEELRLYLSRNGRLRMEEQFLFAPNFVYLRDLFDGGLFGRV